MAYEADHIEACLLEYHRAVAVARTAEEAVQRACRTFDQARGVLRDAENEVQAASARLQLLGLHPLAP